MNNKTEQYRKFEPWSLVLRQTKTQPRPANRLEILNTGYYITKIQLTTILFMLLLTFGSLCIGLINPINYKYFDNSALTTSFAYPLLLAALFCSCNNFQSNKLIERGLQIVTSIVISGTIVVAGLTGMSNIALTACNPIDIHLLHFDQALGFSTPALLNWTAQHPHLKYLLENCYNAWLPEIALLPILATAIGKFKLSLRYYSAFLMALIIAGLIYFFFPTLAPASVLHNPHFTTDQINLVHNFYLRRAGNPNLLPSSGLIAFPSPHVIGATLVVILGWNIRILRYPIIILNAALVFATLALGFHYLADVIAATLISSICFYLSCKLANKAEA